MAYINVFEATGKARCRSCRNTILQGTKAFGIGYRSGDQLRFEQMHLECAQKIIAAKLAKLEAPKLVEEMIV